MLVETDLRSYRFIALSHCWGSSKGSLNTVPKTTTHNIASHEIMGISTQSLPKTFQDVIDTTWRLGVEYIWIDSLCIIQDDDNDKAIELPNMGYIFGNAYLVIAATLAENGDYGLYHGRTRWMFTVSDADEHILKVKANHPSQHSIWNNLKGFWAAPHLPLLYRAWAFQERLLARRIIHFTTEELIWECGTHIECECGELLNPAIIPKLEVVRKSLRTSLKTEYANVLLRGSARDRLRFWTFICEQYSAREITFSQDRLPALSSVARQFDPYGDIGRYLAGIWECSLPCGLMWWASCKGIHSAGATSHWRLRLQRHNVPTWSWLSIHGWVSMPEEAPKPRLRVLNVEYVCCGPDKYGASTIGIIHVASHVAPVKVVVGDRHEDVVVRKLGGKGGVVLQADTRPFEYSHEDLQNEQLLAVMFADGSKLVPSIILKLVPDGIQTDQPRERYQRLGLANCPRAWFHEEAERVIALI